MGGNSKGTTTYPSACPRPPTKRLGIGYNARLDCARVGRVEGKETAVSSSRSSAPHVAVVGVTGAVGQEFLAVLEQRNFPFSNLKLLASARSAGKTQEFKGKTYKIEELTETSFKGVDVALFSAGGSISKKFGPIASEAGATVVDNSSAFRMTENIPLVVPEVNPEALKGWAIGRAAPGQGGGGKAGIIANPNCSTIIMLVPVTPLHRVAHVKRMLVSTYQAASGAGYAAMQELETQTRDVLAGRPAQPKIFKHQYAFNLFSHNSDMYPNGYNQEEMKMVNEAHKIWGDKSVHIAATCVRVPVMRAHAESIYLEFAEALDEKKARELLGKAPGVTLIDDRESNRFPTPLDASHKDDILVGRIRQDISLNGSGQHGLALFVCGDQLRKGAALNAVQIAELLL
ncbi:MAG: aspartate-semialdehyde dehydrogenase [Planctomycetes bacterium]|nr:aspartate-semialdehyde dehydrogenase [Planctomycetota bacterium]